jgi:hypothetical protein
VGERTNAWRNRIMAEQLGTGYELWDLGRARASVHDRLAAKARALGRDYDDDYIAYMLSEHLLLELLNAAEGVERSVEGMRANAAEANSVVAEYFASHPDRNLADGVDRHWASPVVVNVWFEFVHLLIWTRALQDRTSRRGLGGDPQQGLIPAIAPGTLKDAVEVAFAAFQGGHAGEARLWTNYGVHAGLIPNPGTPTSRITRDGTLRFILPGPVTSPIDHWQELDFSQERDAMAFANELFEEVITFVDQVLDAFSAAVPERFRPRQPGD